MKTISEILEQVDRLHRDEFRRYILGEVTSPAFEDYFINDAKAQAAADECLEIMVSALAETPEKEAARLRAEHFGARLGPSIAIEVCERLLDGGKYHAQIKDRPSVWAAGNSVDDAIGNLVRCHPETFGIEIKHLGKQ